MSVSMIGCMVEGTIILDSQGNNAIVNCMVNALGGTAVIVNSSVQNGYDEGRCYRREDHKMFKAIQTVCPCTDSIPLQIACKNGQEIRLYGDDVVFMNSKGELECSLADTISVVKEQQKTINELQKQVEKLEEKLRKK